MRYLNLKVQIENYMQEYSQQFLVKIEQTYLEFNTSLSKSLANKIRRQSRRVEDIVRLTN